MIRPTAETYASVLDISRPTLVQRMIPHRAAFDLVHHPALRDALCRCPRDFLTSLQGVSVRWPKRIDEAVEVRGSNGSLKLTREFVQYALSMDHWSHSPSFIESFPELKGKC